MTPTAFDVAPLVAVENLRRSRVLLKGDLPSPLAPPLGLRVPGRCPYGIAACADAVPRLRPAGPGHLAACIRDDITLTSSVKTAGRHQD